MKYTLFLFLFASFLGETLAQETPATITVRKSDTIAVAFKGIAGSDGATASKVLENDLLISGSVNLVPAERASYTISGDASGGTLKGIVTDARGSTALSKSYSGQPRTTAHQFADDIVETLTGSPGIATTKIAFVSSRSNKKEIYTADYDGANVRQWTNDGGISVAPAISPNASMLAYTGYQSGYADIYTIDLASGARKRIVNFPGTNSGAAFSPDGNRIACSISRDGNPELYIVGANGGGARRLTKTRGVESSPSWSPDGHELVYSSDDSGSPLLFRISAAGGNGSPIPTGHAYNTEPDWSPDGKKIAFVARSGGFNVAVKNLASGATNLLAPAAVNPVWTRNSRHLIYATSDGSSLILMDTKNGRKFPILSDLGKISEPSCSR